MPSGEEINESAGAAKEYAPMPTKSSKNVVEDFGHTFIALIDKLGSKREYSIAKTKIEEAVMWAVKGITG